MTLITARDNGYFVHHSGVSICLNGDALCINIPVTLPYKTHKNTTGTSKNDIAAGTVKAVVSNPGELLSPLTVVLMYLTNRSLLTNWLMYFLL